jgi:transposase
MAVITRVNTDGTADLLVDVPGVTPTSAAALASPLIAAPATAAFTDPPNAAEMALLRTLVNELRTDVNVMATLVNELRAESSGRRSSVVRGGAVGQFDLISTGSDSV